MLKNAVATGARCVGQKMKNKVAPTGSQIQKAWAHSMQMRTPTMDGGHLPTSSGEANNLTCRLASTADRNEIIDFMIQMFITREPLMKCVGATAVDTRPFVEYHVEESLIERASFVAVDNLNGEICGVRLNGIGPSSGNDLLSDFGSKLNTINKFLAHVEENIELAIPSRHFMRHVAICVKPDVVQRGVATELMKESTKFAYSHGLTHMVAVCSGTLPYKLAEKVGFKKVTEIPYGSYIEKVEKRDGKISTFKPFESLESSHYAARLMVKTLPTLR